MYTYACCMCKLKLELIFTKELRKTCLRVSTYSLARELRISKVKTYKQIHKLKKKLYIKIVIRARAWHVCVCVCVCKPCFWVII